jgi:hypothetical protein
MSKFLRPGSLLLPVVFMMIVLTTFGLSGCGDRGDGLPPINEDSVKAHAIPIGLAIQYTASFRNNIDSFTQKCPALKDSFQFSHSEAFNSDVFRLLVQVKDSSGALAAGIRIYYGRATDGQVKLVMVPYDKNGNDIITHLVGTQEKPVPGVSPAKTEALTTDGGAQAMEQGQLCPTVCPPSSPLNQYRP